MLSLIGGEFMKVVAAIDSFKGSLTSIEAGQAAKEGILKACDAQVMIKPIADGGEGRHIQRSMGDRAKRR